eukprot:s7348_g4.t1
MLPKRQTWELMAGSFIDSATAFPGKRRGRHDGSGSISTLELSDIFREFGYRISVEALHHYIDRVDEDGSNQPMPQQVSACLLQA